MSTLISILYTLIILLLLVFVHEFGHFAVAKLCNTKVDELSLGMGPVIFQRQWGETRYSLRALPLGGFCAFDGELEGEEAEEESAEEIEIAEEVKEEKDHSRDLANKAWWQKILILFAGPAMNVVMCIIILTGIVLIGGTIDNTIGEVSEGSPASKVGIYEGVKIVAINDQKVENWSDIVVNITDEGNENQGKPLEISFIGPKDKAITTVSVVPELAEDGRKVIGIKPKIQHRPLHSVKIGVQGTWELTRMMYDVLAGLFNGSVGKDAISGPVGMVNAVETSANMGFIYVAYIAAIISLNLAIINLLPFPSLDGGRIIFVIIRLVTGKAITDEIEGKFHFVGIMLLVLLMIYVTFNDVTRLIK